MNKVRWGILGPGNIAADFVNDFQFVSNGVVQAVASRSNERSQVFADKFQIPIVLDSYEELVAHPAVDAIYVATPHNFHFEQSKLTLNQGKAVLCEKPVTTSLADFQSLRSIAIEKEVLLMEGMWTYFLPAILKAKQWVNEGRIGAVKHVKSDFGFYAPFDPENRLFNPALAGGALLDIGIYPIALANYFLEKMPTDIKVRSRKAESGVDSDLMMSFEYSDALATLHASLECRLPNLTYVIGDKGYITIPNGWQARECSLFIESDQVDHFNDGRTGFGFNYEIEAFNSDLLTGKLESAVVTHKVSERLQTLMEEVRKLF
ncbi:MAG: Gfo/Idh/MocA family oxidoreductase [Cytophagales bacterium]|nr:Gfo/Idh/MocA family oxidoreductase [Cytophagales bacterium]